MNDIFTTELSGKHTKVAEEARDDWLKVFELGRRIEIALAARNTPESDPIFKHLRQAEELLEKASRKRLNRIVGLMDSWSWVNQAEACLAMAGPTWSDLRSCWQRLQGIDTLLVHQLKDMAVDVPQDDIEDMLLGDLPVPESVVVDPVQLTKSLQDRQGLAPTIWNQIQSNDQHTLVDGKAALESKKRQILSETLTRAIRGDSLYSKTAFPPGTLPPSLEALANSKPTGRRLVLLNRRLLGQAFPALLATGLQDYERCALDEARPIVWNYLQRRAQLWNLVNQRNMFAVLLTRRRLRYLAFLLAGAIVILTFFFQGLSGPATISADEIRDLPSLAAKLRDEDPATNVSQLLLARLSKATLDALTNYGIGNREPEPLRTLLLEDLNRLLKPLPIYDSNYFAAVTLSHITETMLHSGAAGQELARLNRMLLSDAYPEELAKPRTLFRWQRWAFCWVAWFGALGAAVSLLRGTPERTSAVTFQTQKRQDWVRLWLGAGGSVFIYALLQSGIFLDQGTWAPLVEQVSFPNWGFFVLGFTSGFSERLMYSALRTIDAQLTSIYKDKGPPSETTPSS